MIFYTAEHQEHDEYGHPENARRVHYTMEFLKSNGFLDRIPVLEPEAIDEGMLRKIHTQELINTVKHTNGWIDQDTYVKSGSYKAALLSAGAAIMAAKSDSTAAAIMRPPGHHATQKRSMGFCLFNNIAIAAELLKEDGKKVAILDFDVHHGNGTNDIFYDTPDVLYISLHRYGIYPGTGWYTEHGADEGEGYTVNIPLAGRVGDDVYLRFVDEIVIPVLNDFEPDILLLSAGYDAHQADPLADMNLSSECYGEIIKRIKKWELRLVLEGGYDLKALAESVYITLSQMFSVDVDYKPVYTRTETADGVKSAMNDRLREIKAHYAQWWTL